MTRANLVLLLAVVASALYLVSVQYESRRLFGDMDRAQLEARRIESVREQLELEKRQQATAQRVEKLAKDRLGMRVATPAITDYVSYQQGQEAGAAPQPRVSGGRLQ
jgi:cell division protein FtsL